MTKNMIYGLVALIVIGGFIWYFMRARAQSATINAGAGAQTPPTVPGAGT